MKKKLDTYIDILGLTEYDEWSYCAEEDIWYEDKKEILPLPKQSTEKVDCLNCEIKVGYDVYPEDTWDKLKKNETETEEYAQYVIGYNDYGDCIVSGILFQTENQTIILSLSDYGMWGLSDFVEKLKTDNYATEYIERYCLAKLTAWTDKNNQTRFVIFSYDKDYCFLKPLFDITIDRNILISKIETIIEEWKNTIRTEVRKQEILLKKSAKNPHCENSVNYFFPEFRTPINEFIKIQSGYLERKHNIKILFAIENGSRNWGMESADSDYDVRFVFYRNPKEYLHINKNTEVITCAFNKEYLQCETHGSLIDMCGFDIYKYLKLLMQSNPTAIEWMFSDVLYYGNNDISLKKEMQKNFNPERLYHHYFSLCKNNYKNFIESEKSITYKKYLYSMRGLLNAEYVAKYNEIPPIKFVNTVESLKDIIPKPVYDEIHNIIRIKSSGKETDKILKIPVLDEYLTEKLKEETPVFEKREPDIEIINDFIDEILIKDKNKQRTMKKLFPWIFKSF